jgi:hypothetical protein
MKFKSLCSLLGGTFLGASALLNQTQAAEVKEFKTETPIEQTVGTNNYCTTSITNADTSIETRCSYYGHHFMSVIEKNKCVAMRFAPGPGSDRWGTSFYPHPFLPGATIKGLTVKQVFPLGSDGIRVHLEGTVSKGTSETFGNYSFELDFKDFPSENRVYGRGYYVINLKDKLSTVNADLNVTKIASHLLTDVPLLDGTMGNTGDTDQIRVVGWNNQGQTLSDFIWNPPTQPAHFPWDFSENLTIMLRGTYNQTDTVRQGYAPIKAAFKPGFGITLQRKSGAQMIFGGIYNLSQSKQFWSDNIGITPLVVKSDPATNMIFELFINSYAAIGANMEDEITLKAQGNTGAYAGVHYTSDLKTPFKRIGSLPFQNGFYSGLVKVPALPSQKNRGFFKVEEEN